MELTILRWIAFNPLDVYFVIVKFNFKIIFKEQWDLELKYDCFKNVLSQISYERRLQKF